MLPLNGQEELTWILCYVHVKCVDGGMQNEYKKIHKTFNKNKKEQEESHKN